MTWGVVGGAAVLAIGSAISADKQAKAIQSGAASQLAQTELGIEETQRASAQGLEFLQPFGDLGQTGVDQAGFLTDPQAQFDFLQNNPLFQMSLENANTQTQNLAAARGRLSAGDTLQQLSQNVLLSAQPLIARQKQSIGDLLNLGTGVSRAQANTAIGTGSDITNLITSQGDISAAGQIGAANVRAQAGKAGIEALALGVGAGISRANRAGNV